MKPSPLDTLAPAILSAAFLLVGCGDNRTPPNNTERTGPAITENETPAPSPEPAAPARAAPSANADGRVATFNGRARLPFPEEGERLTGHLAFTKLADHDAFENPIDPADIPDIVPWDQAGQYVGHTITVEGRIVDIGHTRDGKVNFLNFHADWRGKFYMVVFDDLARTLEDGVEGTFLNKLVRVRGLVEDHRGRPQIKVESMEQVEFVVE